MNQNFAATGSATWNPDIDPVKFDQHISSLLGTPKLIKTMAPAAKVGVKAAASAAPHFCCDPQDRALIVCEGGARIDYAPFFAVTETDRPSGFSYSRMTRCTPPLWLLHQLPNMTAAHLAREWNIQGATLSFNQTKIPLEQGNHSARLLFSSGEAKEILLVAIQAGTRITAAAWHLTHSAVTVSMDSYLDLTA